MLSHSPLPLAALLPPRSLVPVRSCPSLLVFSSVSLRCRLWAFRAHLVGGSHCAARGVPQSDHEFRKSRGMLVELRTMQRVCRVARCQHSLPSPPSPSPLRCLAGSLFHLPVCLFFPRLFCPPLPCFSTAVRTHRAAHRSWGSLTANESPPLARGDARAPSASQSHRPRHTPSSPPSNVCINSPSLFLSFHVAPSLPRRSAPSQSHFKVALAHRCCCICSRHHLPSLSLSLLFLPPPPCILHCAGLIPAGLLYSIMFQIRKNTRIKPFNDAAGSLTSRREFDACSAHSLIRSRSRQVAMI